MRTTLTIEESIMRQLREKAHETGLPLKQIVNTALELGLRRFDERPRGSRYRLKTYPMGVPKGVDLDKALQVASTLKDEEIVRKMAVKK